LRAILPSMKFARALTQFRIVEELHKYDHWLYYIIFSNFGQNLVCNETFDIFSTQSYFYRFMIWDQMRFIQTNPSESNPFHVCEELNSMELEFSGQDLDHYYNIIQTSRYLSFSFQQLKGSLKWWIRNFVIDVDFLNFRCFCFCWLLP
jgi:hypothetical protein